MGHHLFNRPDRRESRRRLRTHGTPAEAALWRMLRGRQVSGLKFRRQHSVGPYVLDFYCPAARLAIELDGAVHDNPAAHAYDAERTRHLEAHGIRVLRFPNRAVFETPEMVRAAVAQAASSARRIRTGSDTSTACTRMS